MLAALSDSDQDRNNLLGAAQALAEATAKLLNSSKPENIEVSIAHTACDQLIADILHVYTLTCIYTSHVCVFNCHVHTK